MFLHTQLSSCWSYFARVYADQFAHMVLAGLSGCIITLIYDTLLRVLTMVCFFTGLGELPPGALP